MPLKLLLRALTLGFLTALTALPAAQAADAIDNALNNQRAQREEPTFLPPEQAFRLHAEAAGPDRVQLSWEIADGYYLYRNRLKVSSPSSQVQLGALILPNGQNKTDEYFGTQQVYHQQLVALLPVARANAAAGLQVPVQVTYQGCAEAGLCYPPQVRMINVSLPAAASGASASAASAASAPGSGGFVSEQDRLAGVIRSGSLLLIVATFFGLGLLLAFTPCVLPMVPILSGIIAGHGEKVTRGRAFGLSLAYVLGMAVTYTVAGVACAAAGRQVQALFQQPWIIAFFAALFIALALSMFGFFTLQLPSALQTRLTGVSNRQTAGTYGGVAIMGALSSLIVTACVAPPLVAILAVIGQSGAMARGGMALFAMSLGMGVPLLAVGASAGELLPRVGAWMDTVKQLFGVLMLFVAAWMLARIVPERWALLLWATPVWVAAFILWRTTGLRRGVWLARTAAALAAVYGIVLVAGAAGGATDPLSPLPQLRAARSELPFRTIKSVTDLDREVAQARSAGRPMMLDFYADWCVSCKEMAKYTFTDHAVQATLGRAVLLRADVTRNDDEDQALLKRFGIFGPPTIAFYGADGAERKNFRVVGFMKALQFAHVAEAAFGSSPVVAQFGSR